MNFDNQARNQVSRPQSSINMADLHIYVVPLELWEEQQNLVLHETINETISAGFLRVEPEQRLSEIRIEIDQQLGYEYIPKDYLFCKSVGRCLAYVREKQENILKVKHFLPPNSYSPELFVVDRIVARRSQMTSESYKTYNVSLDSDLLMESSIQTDRFEYEQEMEIQSFENQNDVHIRQIEINKGESEETLTSDTVKKMQKIENELNLKQTDNISSSDPGLDVKRNEIEVLKKEIMNRYQDLEKLEVKHQEKLNEWALNDQYRKKEEEERRKLFEEMEMERRRQEENIIEKQKEELKKLEEILKDKNVEINKTEMELELERNKRDEIRSLKEKEMKDLEDNLKETTIVNPDMNEKINQLQNDLVEIEKKQKDLEEIARLEREQAEIDFQSAQLEFKRLKKNWEEEKYARDKENEERLLEEQRLREIYEQKERKHLEKMENERRKMIEERERALDIARERFDEEQRHWDEERFRYEEEERKRFEDMENAIQDAYNNKPIIPKFKLNDPDLILEGATEYEQKNHLSSILKILKAEREFEDKIRDNTVKQVRTLQVKIQGKRNNLKDIWRKKYLEEKKKTPPIEDQINRYKDELESIHKKLLYSMEIGIREQKMMPKYPGVLSPSNKANLLLEAFRIQHDIEEIQQKIEFNQMRLSAERKLRTQTENELKMLKIEAMQKKIRLSRTRSDQLAILPPSKSTDLIFSSQNRSISNRSTSNIDSVNF